LIISLKQKTICAALFRQQKAVIFGEFWKPSVTEEDTWVHHGFITTQQ
jgi:hypothetical protein